MKVSKEIQNKMHKLAKLTRQASTLDRKINEYFEEKGMILMNFDQEMEQLSMN